MSLAPFSSALPAAASPSGPPRPSPSCPKPGAASGTAAHASSRAQHATRDHGRTTAATSRGREAFAHVLASVQEQDGGPAAPDTETRATSVRDGGEPDDRHEETSDAVSAEGPASAVVAADEPKPQPAHTGWLLLTLEHGPMVRHEDGPGLEADSAELPATGAVTPMTVDPALGAIAGAQAAIAVPDAGSAGVAAHTEGVASSVAVAGDVEHVTAGAHPSVDAHADLTSSADVVAPDAGATAGLAAEGTTAADTLAVGEPPAQRGAEPPQDHTPHPSAAPDAPTHEAIARWRAAARAVGADVDGMAGKSTPAAAPDAVPDPPGTAVSRLAHLVGRHGEHTAMADAEVATVAVPEAGVTVPAVPTARAADVLQHLVQAAPRPESVGREGDGAQAAALAQALASTAATPAPADPVARPTAAPLPHSVGEQVTSQIVASLRMQWKEGIGEARLHLRPDALGAVTVSLRVEQGAVTAVVRADSPQVQDWVLQHQQTLRQQMEAAGLRLDELTVSPDDRGQREQQDAPPQERRRARRAPAADSPDTPRFEVLA